MREMNGSAEAAKQTQAALVPEGLESPRTLKSLLENLEAPFQLKLLASLLAGLQ